MVVNGDKGLQLKYFVLKPRGNTMHAVACRAAMRKYAEIVASHDPQFSSDLNAWTAREEQATGVSDVDVLASLASVSSGTGVPKL